MQRSPWTGRAIKEARGGRAVERRISQESNGYLGGAHARGDAVLPDAARAPRRRRGDADGSVELRLASVVGYASRRRSVLVCPPNRARTSRGFMFLRHLRPLTGLAVFAFVMFGLSACGVNKIPTLDEQVKAAWSEVLNQYQ